MGRRVENESSDAVCALLYKGEEVYDRRTQEKDNIIMNTKNAMESMLKSKMREQLDLASHKQISKDSKNAANKSSSESEHEGDERAGG